jgi:hypothetical protein
LASHLASLEYRKRASTKTIILHGGHTPHDKSNLKDWLLVNGRKLGLLSIGYHFVIFPDGYLLSTRPHDCIGSHAPGHNKDSIGVYLGGGVRYRQGPDGEQIAVQCDDFKDAQWETLRGLMANMRMYYPEVELKGHGELGRNQHRNHMCPPVDMNRVRTLCLPQN